MSAASSFFKPTPVPSLPGDAHQAPDRRYGSTSAPPGAGPAPTLVHESGGETLFQLRNPAFRPISQLFSRLPLAAMYDDIVSPSNPITYEVGSYTVPANTQLWVYDYEFTMMRFSGIQAGAMVPAEDGAFFGQIAFDISINGTRRDANLVNELDPRPIQLQKELYTPPPAGAVGRTPPVAAILRAQQEQYASASGLGQAALPQTSQTYAPRGRPFTLRVLQGDRLELKFSVFRPLRLPIAAIMGRFAGYEISSNLAEALVGRTRPA